MYRCTDVQMSKYMHMCKYVQYPSYVRCVCHLVHVQIIKLSIALSEGVKRAIGHFPFWKTDRHPTVTLSQKIPCTVVPESVHHRKFSCTIDRNPCTIEIFSCTQAVQAVQAVHCLVRRAKGEFLVNARKKAKPNFQRRAVVSFWLMQETHRALVSFLH